MLYKHQDICHHARYRKRTGAFHCPLLCLCCIKPRTLGLVPYKRRIRPVRSDCLVVRLRVTLTYKAQLLWTLSIAVELLCNQLLATENNLTRSVVANVIVWGSSLLVGLLTYWKQCSLMFTMCVPSAPSVKWGLIVAPHLIICILIVALAVVLFLHKASLYTGPLQFLCYWKLEDVETKKIAKESFFTLLFFLSQAGCFARQTSLLFFGTTSLRSLSFFEVLAAGVSDGLSCIVTFIFFHYFFGLWPSWKRMLRGAGDRARGETDEEYLHLL